MVTFLVMFDGKTYNLEDFTKQHDDRVLTSMVLKIKSILTNKLSTIGLTKEEEKELTMLFDISDNLDINVGVMSDNKELVKKIKSSGI